MANTIKDLTGYLTAARVSYHDDYKRAVEARKAAKKELNENYVKNTKLYGARQGKIEDEFEKTIVQARKAAVDLVLPHIEALREHEKMRVQKIDETALGKINMLNDINVSEEEMAVLVEKYGTGKDYWSSRALAEIAEKNGIDPAVVNIESSFSLKMSIIDNLEDQLTNMLIRWNPENKHNFENDVLLSGDVLDRAQNMYEKGEHGREDRSVEAAYYRILSTTNPAERGLAIGSMMRNMKGERRDALMFKIANIDSLSQLTLDMSGCGEEISEWTSGKSEEYKKAVRMIQDVSSMRDPEVIKHRVVELSDNQFVSGMLENEMKHNEFLKNVLKPETEAVQE